MKKEALSRRCKELGFLDLSNELDAFFVGLESYDGSFYYDKKLAGKILDIEKLASTTSNNNIENGVKTLTAQWWNPQTWMDKVNPQRPVNRQQQQADEAMSNWQTIRQDQKNQELINQNQRQFEEQSQQFLNQAKQQMAMEVQDELVNVVEMGNYLNSAWQTINMHHQNYIDSIGKLETAYQHAKQKALESAQDDTVRQWLEQKTFSELDNSINSFKSLLNDEEGVDVNMASQMASQLYKSLTGSDLQVSEPTQSMDVYQHPQKQQEDNKWKSIEQPVRKPEPVIEFPSQHVQEKDKWKELIPPGTEVPGAPKLQEPTKKDTDKWKELTPPDSNVSGTPKLQEHNKWKELIPPGTEVPGTPKLQEPEKKKENWETIQTPKVEETPINNPQTYNDLSGREKSNLTKNLNKYLRENFNDSEGGLNLKRFPKDIQQQMRDQYLNNQSIPVDLMNKYMESILPVKKKPSVEQPIEPVVDTPADKPINKPTVNSNPLSQDGPIDMQGAKDLFDRVWDMKIKGNEERINSVRAKDFKPLIDMLVKRNGLDKKEEITNMVQKFIDQKSPKIEKLRQQMGDFNKAPKKKQVQPKPKQDSKPVEPKVEQPKVNEQESFNGLDPRVTSKLIDTYGEGVNDHVSNYLDMNNVNLDNNQQKELFQRLDNLGMANVMSDDYSESDAISRVKDRLPSIVDMIVNKKSKQTTAPSDIVDKKPSKSSPKPDAKKSPRKRKQVNEERKPLDMKNELTMKREEAKEFLGWLKNETGPDYYKRIMDGVKSGEQAFVDQMDSYKKEFLGDKAQKSIGASSWKTIKTANGKFEEVKPFKRTLAEPYDNNQTRRINNDEIQNYLINEEQDSIPKFETPKIIEQVEDVRPEYTFNMDELVEEDSFDYKEIYKNIDNIMNLVDSWLINPNTINSLLGNVQSQLSERRTDLMNGEDFSKARMSILGRFWGAVDMEMNNLKNLLAQPHLNQEKIMESINSLKKDITKAKFLEDPNLSIEDLASRAAMSVAVPDSDRSRFQYYGMPKRAPAKPLGDSALKVKNQ